MRAVPASAGAALSHVQRGPRPPASRPVAHGPGRDPPQRLADDGAAHLRLAVGALDERDRDLAHPHPRPLHAERDVDLEAVALRGDRRHAHLGQRAAPEAAVAAGDVVQREPQRPARVDVARAGEQAPVPRPALGPAAGHVAGTEDDVGVPGRRQQAGQLLRGVRAVGVHLHDPPDAVGEAVAPAVQHRAERVHIGRAETGPRRVVVHPDAGVGRGDRLGERAGAVGAAVVDDEDPQPGQGVQQPRDEAGEALALVVRGDGDQHVGPVRTRSRHAASRRRRTSPTATAPSPSATSTHSGPGPTRVASVVVVRSGTVSTSSPGVNSGPGARDERPVGRHDRALPARGGDDDGAVVLDRAQPRHPLLLVGHVAVPEGRVVGGHREQVGPAADGVAHRVVEHDLVAGHDAEPGRAGGQHTRAGAGLEVGDAVDQRRDELGDAAQRDVLAEREDVALHVRRARTPARHPDDRGVARPLDQGAVRGPGAGQDGADHHRHPDLVGHGPDLPGGVGVADRVDVRGVLGPDHQVGAGGPACADVVGEAAGLRDVVVEHGPALGVEVEARARDVALHGGHRDRRARGVGAHRRQRREPREGPEQDGDQGARRGTGAARGSQRAHEGPEARPRTAPRRSSPAARRPARPAGRTARRAGRTRPSPRGSRRRASAR